MSENHKPIEVKLIVVGKHHAVNVIWSYVIGSAAGNARIFEDGHEIRAGVERCRKIKVIDGALQISCSELAGYISSVFVFDPPFTIILRINATV